MLPLSLPVPLYFLCAACCTNYADTWLYNQLITINCNCSSFCLSLLHVLSHVTGSSVYQCSAWLNNQLFDRVSCTYSYLLADGSSKLALLIDPVRDLVQRDVTLIEELGVRVCVVFVCSLCQWFWFVSQLKYVLNTHVHADHVTGSGELKQRLTGVSSVISKSSGAVADVLVSDGDVISCGESINLKVLSTPGQFVLLIWLLCAFAQNNTTFNILWWRKQHS